MTRRHRESFVEVWRMLSQSVGYAITALGHLARRRGQPTLVRDISSSTGIPNSYLAKIIHLLGRKGFVLTQRGIGGGVILARDPGSVSLFDLCAALDEPLVNQRCLLGGAECSDERDCPAHAFWSAHRTQLIDFLKRTTLADMAAFEGRQEHQRSDFAMPARFEGDQV